LAAIARASSRVSRLMLCWRAGHGGAKMRAFTRLIDENGQPTQAFEGIRLASADEFKKRFEDWLKAADPGSVKPARFVGSGWSECQRAPERRR